MIKSFTPDRKDTISHRQKTNSATSKQYSTLLPEIRNRNNDFNKYYITPAMRYKPKIDNPQKNPENFEDETYIYRNLHNYQFWNWVHPLSDYQLKQTDSQVSQKVSITALEKFKHHMQQKSNKRVPIIVKELLRHQQ